MQSILEKVRSDVAAPEFKDLNEMIDKVMAIDENTITDKSLVFVNKTMAKFNRVRNKMLKEAIAAAKKK